MSSKIPKKSAVKHVEEIVETPVVQDLEDSEEISIQKVVKKVKEPKAELAPEPVVKQKKTRSEAQLAQFAKALAVKKANAEDKPSENAKRPRRNPHFRKS